MRLRVRHSEGTATLLDVNQNQTVSNLKERVKSTIFVDDTQDIQISGGYPPKFFTNMNITLTDAGLRDGDILYVKVLEVCSLEKSQQENTTTAPSGISNTLKEGSVQTANGVLQLRVMDDDNSCLFRSIVIADGIKRDPDMYSDVTLGQSRDEYMAWIQKPTSWGGAIGMEKLLMSTLLTIHTNVELAIFSGYFGIEIDSIDVQTGRIDKFGEGLYENRVLIVYSGIHYDALALAPAVDSSSDFDQTQFPVAEVSILDAAKELIDGLRRSHRFTDIANFTIKCEQCNTGLKGEKDAQDHATVSVHDLLI
ncbi:hypothetical protein [Parasitella parasitica]|uniref:Ubiquitin thioesterase OTU n=1 Tax=Parasitella parasitica TaxID=35722 RepID=A0A0B7MVZ6_9FUNG|nr:hypothetical protein [Parasitella parasitica]